jgi:ADP-ribosyl-[dinitrogen reductase] hydrolase
MTMNLAFLESVRGGFLGLAVGDALGVPVETMSHEAILAATGGVGVTDYMLPKQTRVKDTENLPPGSTSDDTQLARVTGRSLARCRRFEIVDQGLALVEEFEASTFGWGGTTTEAAKAIQLWSITAGREGRHPGNPAPLPSSDGNSAGSGPAMKIFPLAAYELFGREGGEDQFLAHAMELGLMTHGDPRAVIASYALGIAIGCFASPMGHLDVETFRKETAGAVLRESLRAESLYKFFRPRTPTFSSLLARAFDLMGDPDALRKEANASFLAVHSVPFAIATALRHPRDFRGAVLEGVNAGKDTDTVGSMIGAMLGSRCGVNGIPSDWVAGLRDKDAILADADALATVTLGGDPLDAKRVLPPWLRDKTH